MSKGFTPCLGEFVHKNAEAIIALFTIILGIATWLLWRATDRLVKGADINAERQLRPYVHASSAHFIWGQDGPRVALEISNSGETPATFFEIGAVSRAIRRGHAEPVAIPTELIFRRWVALGGGKSTTISVRGIVPGIETGDIVEPFAVDAREVLDAKGEKNFFLLGCIRYGDVFGNEYETEFALFTRTTTPNNEIKMMNATGNFAVFRRTKRGAQAN